MSAAPPSATRVAAPVTAPAPRPARDEGTRRLRRTAVGDARACVLSGVASTAVVLTVGPLVEGPTWLAPTVVAVLTVTVVGVLAALARVPAAVGALLAPVAGFVVCTALFAPATAALGGFVPTPSSTATLADLVAQGVRTSNTVSVPAPATPDIQALVAVAAAALTAAVQMVAAWARHPGVAGLPLLLTVCVPAALAPDGIGTTGFLVAGAGFLALTLSDADARIRQWGPLLRRRSAAGPDPVAASAAPTAVVGGVVALVIALVVPALVPGIGRDSLNEAVQDAFGGDGVQRVSTVNPFLDLGRDLTRPEDVEVLTYTTGIPDPTPLRIVTTDVADADSWGPSEPTLPVDQTVDQPLPRPPGVADAVLDAAQRVRTDIRVTGLDQRYLPLPYPPAQVEIEGSWLYDPETLNVLSGSETTLDTAYGVDSYVIDPTADVLRAAPPPPGEVVERYTALPELPPVVSETAREVTAAATTRYDQAVALQQFFRDTGGFTYAVELDDDATDDGGTTAVEAFLSSRRGYCVQFASSMALMARSLGIPARVAVGFLPGDQVEGIWTVTIRDAHAWPELYFDGIGWVRFEPTPAARTGVAPPWAAPAEQTPATAAPTSDAASAAAPSPTAAPSAAPRAEAAAGGGGDGPRWWLPVLVVAALLALAALPRAWRWGRDRLRWRRAGSDPRALADTAWGVLHERAGDLGWRWGRGTLREEAAALVAAAELPAPAREALWRLVEAAERARFAAAAAPAAGLRGGVAEVVRALAEGRSQGTRLRATWLPHPLPQRRPTATAAIAGAPRTGAGARQG